MGRWAQRRHGGGGGGPITTGANLMILISNTGFSTTEATYLLADDLDNFNNGDFTSNPSGETSNAYNQVDPTTVEIQFTGDVSSDASIIYNGTEPGIQSPQSINY